MTQKSCAVGMRNAILRNHLNQMRVKNGDKTLKWTFGANVIFIQENAAFISFSTRYITVILDYTHLVHLYARTSCVYGENFREIRKKNSLKYRTFMKTHFNTF